MNASQAVQEGMIWKAVADENLADTVAETAAILRDGPTKTYVAVRKTLDAASTQSLTAQLAMEADIQLPLSQSEDFKEGVRAFREKRAPIFKGK